VVSFSYDRGVRSIWRQPVDMFKRYKEMGACDRRKLRDNLENMEKIQQIMRDGLASIVAKPNAGCRTGGWVTPLM